MYTKMYTAEKITCKMTRFIRHDYRELLKLFNSGVCKGQSRPMPGFLRDCD